MVKEIVVKGKNLEVIKELDRNIKMLQKDVMLICETIIRQEGDLEVKYTLDIEKGLLIPEPEKEKVQ